MACVVRREGSVRVRHGAVSRPQVGPGLDGGSEELRGRADDQVVGLEHVPETSPVAIAQIHGVPPHVALHASGAVGRPEEVHGPGHAGPEILPTLGQRLDDGADRREPPSRRPDGGDEPGTLVGSHGFRASASQLN